MSGTYALDEKLLHAKRSGREVKTTAKIVAALALGPLLSIAVELAVPLIGSDRNCVWARVGQGALRRTLDWRGGGPGRDGSRGKLGMEGKMAETANKRRNPRYVTVAGVILVTCVVAASVTLFLRDRNEKEMLSQLERSQADLRMLGGRIANIKDADLTTANDFISAYAQIEPLEKEYEVKLQRFSGLYERARERDSRRGWLDLERLRGRHHPETWEKMSEIIGLVREINEVTKRQISVVRAMASLPEPERMRFWHEQFMPLAAQEHALREQLQVVGQGRTPDSSVQ
ncbi:MAG: hypothetical protein JSS69_15040 [Acidobacteria bacterium]|nr:hypothetical protein [Acidobacteriota bacterium]MBS1867227.1 hypothetical protein [Acidobacteriota bacterium]